MKLRQLLVIFVAGLFFCCVSPVVAQDAEEETENSEEYVFDPEEAYDAINLTDDVLPNEELIEREVEEEKEVTALKVVETDDNFSTPVLVILAVAGLITSALWVVMLIDAIKRPLAEYPGTSASRKILWVGGILVTHVISSILYYVAVYRRSTEES